MLDKEFAQEIKKVANGDGSLEARFAFRNTAWDAVKRLSNPSVMRNFKSVLKEYGRVVIAICLAVTINERRAQLHDKTVRWGDEVLRLWKNRPNNIDCFCIHDGLHPSRIEEYARSFIDLTIDE